MVKPRFFVALQAASHRPANARRAIAFQRRIQQLGDHLLYLRHRQRRLGWREHQRAYHALRVVLHALRDRLSIDQAAALAAQLPMLIRGFYYEGWHPHGKPGRERHKEEFLAHIAAAFRDDPEIDPEEVTRAVLQVVSKRVSAGEIANVKQSLPTELRALWS